MAIKKIPGNPPAADQADLFSNAVEMDETAKAGSAPKGPNDPHDPKTIDLNEDNKDLSLIHI